MDRPFVLVLVVVLVLDPMAWFRGRGRAGGRLGSWSQCTVARPRGLSMNRSAELRSGANKPCRVTIAPGRRPALRFRGSWSRCMRKKRKGAFHEPARPSNCSLPWESGAEDARTPNANAWSIDPAASAKRLECVRFIGAFRPARNSQRFRVPMVSKKERGSP